MKTAATVFMLALAVLVSAYHLPALYERVAVKWVEKTHLFYSPTLKDFIYTEPTAGHDPEAAAKAEDHHADVAYKDARGRYYDRVAFERHLPFIYVRNMDRRGLLPMAIDGRAFDRRTIDAHRQVLELSAKSLPGHTPAQQVWPLLDTDPAQAGLVFPDDRFRFTGDAMEFVNADFNRVDDALTDRWTAALRDAGFAFPARSVAGNFTILKPFDDGVFVVDDAYAVYHLRRVAGEALVTRTPIDPALRPRHITVVESNLRQFHGLLLDGQGRLHLLTTDDYRLVPLDLPDYDPERMDCKILFDPLYQTAVYADDATVRAVVFDHDGATVAAHEHRMSRAAVTPAQRLGRVLFPFRLVMASETSRLLVPRLAAVPGWAGYAPVVGAASALAFAGLFRLRYRRRPRTAGVAFVFLTGLYGLIAGLMVLDE